MRLSAPRWLQRLSLRQRLIGVIFLVSTLASLAGFAIYTLHQTAIIRDSAMYRAQTLTGVIADYSVTDLLFNDDASAAKTLAPLAKLPDLREAYLFAADGRLAASVRRGHVDYAALRPDGIHLEDGAMHVVEPITHQQQRLGTLYLIFTVESFQDQLVRVVLTPSLVLVIVLLLSLALAASLQTIISRPILHLAQFARNLTREIDFSARVEAPDEREIGDLYKAFNALLARIEVYASDLAYTNEQLRDSSARVGLLLDSTAEAIYGLDLTGRCTFVNPSCLRILGYSNGDALIGRDIHRLIRREPGADPTISPSDDSLLAILRDGGAIHADDEEFWRADGTPIAVEYWSHPILKDGAIVGGVVAFVDITARKQAEQEILALNQQLEQRVRERTTQLAEANRELEAFSYSVSHDLRAPLRAVDGFSQALLEDYAGQLDSQGMDYLRRVRNSAQHMGELIEDLLKLARISRAPLQSTRVDLSALAAEIVARLRRESPHREVIVDIAPSLICNGDPGLLRIVMENLLDNAWKYTGKTADARIGVERQRIDDQLVYCVRDNGAGFNMKFAAKLFGAFQRLHEQTDFAGTGVGLATVARVIRRHGGRVWANAQPGQGAQFYFTLPN